MRKDAISLKESENRYMGEFGERTGKEEIL